MDPLDFVGRFYRDSESSFAQLSEQLVQRDSFGEVLAWSTENVMAMAKITFGVCDLVVHFTRLAGRSDLNRLSRQLARTEDKLERVLQELEELRSEARATPPPEPVPEAQ